MAVIISLFIGAGACGKVIVYTAQWCPFCVSLEKYLDAHNVDYEMADVDKNASARQEATDKSSQSGIPVLDWNGEIIVGFGSREAAEIDRLIAGGAPVQGKNRSSDAETTIYTIGLIILMIYFIGRYIKKNILLAPARNVDDTGIRYTTKEV